MNQASRVGIRPLASDALELLRQAEACAGRGEFARADDLLGKGLALAPDHPQLLMRHAMLLHMQKRFSAAAATLQRVLQSCPDDATIYNNLGSALGAANDVPGAAAALRRACELAPQRADYWYNLAKALEAATDAEGACAALTRVLDLASQDTQARLMRADSLRILGRAKESEDDLRHILARDPGSVAAWTRLVSLRTGRLGGDDLAQIEHHYLQPNIDADRRIWLGFAYGLALEADHRHTEAFPVLVEANAARRNCVRWDAQAMGRLVDDIMGTFVLPLPQAPDPTQGREVIFLFGMPRSGSTLLEQILCAHPRVEGAGEIDDLDAVLSEESARRGDDVLQWAPKATASDWARLGGNYLDRTARWRRSRPVFTDKGLDNWRTVGIARAMLPGARFIHCRRDPLETCWSCFKHVFAKGQLLYSYDFRDLAAYWHDCTRMVRFWRNQYPDLIYDHVYEDLVRQPEAQIRRLLDHCELPFDPACMRFHEIERSVRNTSAGQVRRPLDSGTAVAARYGTLLHPLRQALAVQDRH